MRKYTFYFSHDYNSRSDEKIKNLIRKHGVAGYGIFWCIIEDLYNNANALRLDYEGIAYDLRVDANVIKSIINDFDLFITEDDYFGSSSVERRLDERNDKSKKARESALKRWNRTKKDANALQTHCEGNAIKERKGKEKKEKEKKTPYAETEEKSVPASPSVDKKKIEFNYETGKYTGITDVLIKYWREQFPAINIEQEIKKSENWLFVNKKNRKKDLLRFLGNWLARVQERAPATAAISKEDAIFDAQKERWEEIKRKAKEDRK